MAKRLCVVLGAAYGSFVVFGCGGASSKSPATGGASSHAGSAASGSAHGGGNSGAPNASGASGMSAGVGGTFMLPSDQCQTERAAACQALVGEAFLEVSLGGSKYHLGAGCDPACGEQEVPMLATGLESNNQQSIGACSAATSAELVMSPPSVPSQVSLCSRAPYACTIYRITEWTAESVAARTGVLELLGHGVARPADEPQAQASPITLHYVLCN